MRAGLLVREKGFGCKEPISLTQDEHLVKKGVEAHSHEKSLLIRQPKNM